MIYLIFAWKAFWVLASIVTVYLSFTISYNYADKDVSDDDELEAFAVMLAFASISICTLATSLISWITIIHFLIYFLIGFVIVTIAWRGSCKNEIKKYQNGKIEYDTLVEGLDSSEVIVPLLTAIAAWPVFVVAYIGLKIEEWK